MRFRSATTIASVVERYSGLHGGVEPERHDRGDREGGEGVAFHAPCLGSRAYQGGEGRNHGQHSDADGERAGSPEPVLEHAVLEPARREVPAVRAPARGLPRRGRQCRDRGPLRPSSRPATRSHARAAPARCARLGQAARARGPPTAPRAANARVQPRCTRARRRRSTCASRGSAARAIRNSASVAAGYASGSSTRNGEYESAGAAAAATAAKSAHGLETTSRASP